MLSFKLRLLLLRPAHLSLSAVTRKRRQGSALSVAEKLEKSDLDYKKKHLPPVVPIWKHMTVLELADSLGKSIDHLFEVMIYVPNTDAYDDPNSSIDNLAVIREIVKKSGLRCVVSAPTTVQVQTTDHLELNPRAIVEADLRPRPPVVTIMGHVDHGKTTLLDALRNSNIVDGEAGGITQHIGAFRVKVGENWVTFLDTPGHAAFSALRNRGAQATDMVILVVAADDGVMDQTRESIVMAKNSDVPVIVAINKIDKGNADIERAKEMLLQEGIQLEDHGGDVQSVSISALKGTNLSALMDVIQLQSEMMNLQSETRGKVEGVVLESRIDAGRGKLCSAIVQRGVLRKSSILVAGSAWAKVRGLFDENNTILYEAGPSTPVEIIGWRELPSPGEKIYEVDSEKLAKEIVEHRERVKMGEKQEEDSVAIESKTLEHLADYRALLLKKRQLRRRKLRPSGPRPKETPKNDPHPKLNILIKADVDGSVESFLDVIETYTSAKCSLNIIHYGVGEITPNDLTLADAFQAVIYAYGVQVPDRLKPDIKKLSIQVRESRVIYRLVEELRKDIEFKLPMVNLEEEIGLGNVLQSFEVTEGKRKLMVAGARCTKGSLEKGERFKVLRVGGGVVFDGKVTSMRHLKNEVDSIKNGVECGIMFEDTDVTASPGDTIICYKMVQVKQKTDWDPGF